MRSKAIHFISSVLLLTTLFVTQTSSSVAHALVSVQAQTSIGSQHVVALGSNGTVWTWGSLIPGPTGVGSKDALASPTQVVLPADRTAVDVAATYNASFAVANDGTVWAWGTLGRGLGDTAVTTDARYVSPVQVAIPGGVSIAEVSAACEGVMARASNGDVYQWGYFYGNWQMSYTTPTKVAGVANATSISRGCSTSFAVAANGSAYAWGSNGGGRLGDGTTTDRLSPVTISLPNSKTFTRISTSSSHALAMASDGSLYGWGGNSNGQLGADPNAVAYSATPRAISIGSTTAVAISTTDTTPFSIVVTSANTVLKWGGWSSSEYVPSAMTLPTSDLSTRTLVDVSTYQNAAIFVANDNSLWAKGGWSSVDLDGNCGATATDYAMWKDGMTIPARSLVRTVSKGQFGPAFTEDQFSIAKMETASGSPLPLDGSGTTVAAMGTDLVVTVTAPRSACFPVDRLTYSFSDDNGATWQLGGIETTTNAYAQTVVNITYTPASSGRKRAQFKISNPDDKSTVYKFSIGVAATSTGSGTITSSELPVVESANDTAVAIGSDEFLYSWGAATAITGTADAVKEPTRVYPSVAGDRDLAFRSVAIGSLSNGTAAAAAVSKTGRLFVWGSASTDLLLGTIEKVSSPTEILMPPGKKALKVFVGGGYNCSNSGGGRSMYGLVLDEDGKAYTWGGPAAANPNCDFIGWTNGAVITAVSALGALSFSNAVPLGYVQDATSFGINIALKHSSGEWYQWTTRKVNSCSPTCTYSWKSPNSLGISSDIISYGNFQIDSQYSSGLFDVSAGGLLRFSTLNQEVWTLGTPTTVSLPGSRTVRKISSSSRNSETRVIASDGTLWRLYSNSIWGKEKINVPLDALPLSRFASSDGNFLLGNGGSVWNYRSWETSLVPGSCAVVPNNDEEGSSEGATRVASSGQFGSAFTEDSFKNALDSPNFVGFADRSYNANPPKISNAWGKDLAVRPGATVRLYSYFNSSCVGTTGLSMKWDLDDDGVFETDSVVSDVVSEATSLVSRYTSSTGEVTWDGITPAEYKQSYVDISAASLGGALSDGGGRFISVKYSSAKGSATQRYAVTVQPKKPTGRVGVTVNASARFTDSTDVTIGLVWPEGTTTALISNDGSFSDAQEVPVASTVRWSLPSGGSGLLSSTVYVRFYGLWANGAGGWATQEQDYWNPVYNYTDDIILDLSPPEITSVSASTTSSAQSQSLNSARAFSAPTATALVSITALDAVSGISAVQITTDPAVPGPERMYARQYRVTADRGNIAVRAKDNVGHWSDWNYVRISGFVAAPEEPSVVPETPVTRTPAAETPAAAPVAAAPAASPSAPSSASQSAPAAVAVVAVKATAVLKGSTANIAVTVPSSLAKTCTTKTVKGKKVTTCKAAPIVVSVSGGATKTYSAKSGSNAFKVPAKKGATVTIKVGGKVIQKIKL